MNNYLRGVAGCLLVLTGWPQVLWGQETAEEGASGAAVPSMPLVSTEPVSAEVLSELPEALRDWEGWVLGRHPELACPPDYRNATQRICVWPGRLDLVLRPGGAEFRQAVTVFSPSWVALPGSSDRWPQNVLVNGSPAAVLARQNRPSVYLVAGTYQMQGDFVWSQMPQTLRLPPETGMVWLQREGETEAAPTTWGADQLLWLRRDRVEQETQDDFFNFRLYARLQDGIPLWLELRADLTVAGKSREEVLGLVLPAGWKLAALESDLPVAISPEGVLRAQVRAGQWTVSVRAFRLQDTEALQFAEGETPAVESMLVGLALRPDFRLWEMVDAPLVDVEQTTFPQAWRNLPVFEWKTNQPLRLTERQRGAGEQAAAPLTIQRSWWLAEDGTSFTFRDSVIGRRQHLWRLDAASGTELGAVLENGRGQLLTFNPATQAQGVEIRLRDFTFIATGTLARSMEIPASGWLAPAENVRVNLHLPPGWRLIAALGPDWVNGEWITQWSLLDLFLLLLFTFAVFRLAGFVPGLLAFLTFGLFYHEPGAPVYLWLILLVPLALRPFATTPYWQNFLAAVKWLVAGVLVLVLIPFFSAQIQQALFPQLERGADWDSQEYFFAADLAESAPMPQAAAMPADMVLSTPSAVTTAGEVALFESDKATPPAQWRGAPVAQQQSNLLYDSKARIQTGPAVPEWKWRSITFGWNGPVSPQQTVDLVLLPSGWNRALTVLRMLLILVLLWALLRERRGAGGNNPGTQPPPLPVVPAHTPGVALLSALFLALGGLTPVSASAFPGPELLQELEERLTRVPPVFPDAAQISRAELVLQGNVLTVRAEVQTGARVAVPLPVQVPAWSPLAVRINGQAAPALRRGENSLWVVLEEGAHTVEVEGRLGEVNEWTWSFLLPPRRVVIEAEGWNVRGVSSDGVPEAQVFFSRMESAAEMAAADGYERPEVTPLAQVSREVEIGLIWKVRTTVRRLTPGDQGISLRLPVLPGERVLSSEAVVEDGAVEIRLGSGQETVTWEGEMEPVPELSLQARTSDTWVEQWRLVVSPIWNIQVEGLPPVWTDRGSELVPEWNPWPGETVALSISRPEALPGATVTVQQVRQEVTIGQRQRTTKLELLIEASLGEEFLLTMPEGAEVTSYSLNAINQPVRVANGQLLILLRPGTQRVVVEWRVESVLGREIAVDPVRLPVESANVEISLRLPEDRWVLWTKGPVRGPAVRFWVVVAAALLAAVLLGRLRCSPLRTWQWALLALGLTQVPLPAAVMVVGWLFFLVWRGQPTFQKLESGWFNFLQIVLALGTGVVLLVFIGVVAAGLLGDPEMFIAGQGSSALLPRWFQPLSGPDLPQPMVWAVSDWWYRLAMLAWALWLAWALLQWLQWGWKQFRLGGCWKQAPHAAVKK
jgi:hypothetical protein